MTVDQKQRDKTGMVDGREFGWYCGATDPPSNQFPNNVTGRVQDLL